MNLTATLRTRTKPSSASVVRRSAQPNSPRRWKQPHLTERADSASGARNAICMYIYLMCRCRCAQVYISLENIKQKGRRKRTQQPCDISIMPLKTAAWKKKKKKRERTLPASEAVSGSEPTRRGLEGEMVRRCLHSLHGAPFIGNGRLRDDRYEINYHRLLTVATGSR